MEQRTTMARGWLAGLTLGAVNGIGLLTVGALAVPLVIVSILLIAWKGPRLVAGSGLITGAGLMWTVLFVRVALTCGGPLDSGSGTCVAGELGPWIAVATTIFIAGLVGSAFAFRRARRAG